MVLKAGKRPARMEAFALPGDCPTGRCISISRASTSGLSAPDSALDKNILDESAGIASVWAVTGMCLVLIGVIIGWAALRKVFVPSSKDETKPRVVRLGKDVVVFNPTVYAQFGRVVSVTEMRQIRWQQVNCHRELSRSAIVERRLASTGIDFRVWEWPRWIEGVSADFSSVPVGDVKRWCMTFIVEPKPNSRSGYFGEIIYMVLVNFYQDERSTCSFKSGAGDFVGPRCSVGSFLVCAPLETGKRGVGNQHSKADYFRSKLYVIEPISIFVVGWLIMGWGWWRLRFSRPGCWTDWWLGLAAMFLGLPIGSLGLAIFLIRVF